MNSLLVVENSVRCCVFGQKLVFDDSPDLVLWYLWWFLTSRDVTLLVKCKFCCLYDKNLLCVVHQQNLINMDIMGQKESFQKLAHSNYSSIFSRLVQKTRGICSRTVACCICFGAFCIISRGTVGNKASPELQMKKRYFMYYWYHSGLGVKFTEMKLERSLNRALNLVRCVHR